MGNAARVKWVAGRVGEPPAYEGTDFAIANGDKLTAVYYFVDELP